MYDIKLVIENEVYSYSSTKTIPPNTKIIDFSIISLKRKQIPANVSGTFTDAKLQKPLSNASYSIILTPPVSPAP